MQEFSAYITVLCLLLGAGACLVILVQDIRSRWVHVVPLGLVAVAGIGYGYGSWDGAWWLERAVNLGFLGVLLLSSAIVMWLRGVRTPFIDGQIGLGDMVYLAAVSVWMAPFGFLLYFVSGVMVVLGGVLMYLRLREKGDGFTVPLAGLMAGYALVYWPFYTWILEAYLEGILLEGVQ